MIKRFLQVSAFTLLSLFLLTSCFNNPYKTVREAEGNIGGTQNNIAQAQKDLETRAPAALVKSGYYVNTSPVNLNKPPAWMNDKISLRTESMPFNLLVSRILRNTSAIVSYQNNVQADQPVSMNYTGTIKGALDQLAARTNYAYEIDSNNVTWQAVITRTFNISFMPGTSNYLVGQNAGTSSSTSTGGAGNMVTVQGNLGNEQYSNLQAQLSVWQDLTKTLTQLKSTDGKIFVSEATTSVTVQDHPSNVFAMQQYIDQLNKMMSKQVSLQVTVLELTLSKEFNYGIDWNVVLGSLNATKFAVGGNTGTAANATGIVTQTSGANSGLMSIAIGRSDANRAIIQALSTQGKVSVVTQPTVVTMNNQIAEIRITRDTGYLQSISTTTAVNAGSTTSLTPGVVTDGFSLYLLPKLQNNKVYLQISSTLSNLTNLREVNNKGISSISDDVRTQSDFQAIQVPSLAEKHFNQRTVLQSGSTLIITGFQQTQDRSQEVSPFGVTAIGGKGASTNNVQTIVCITPTIIEGQG